MCGAFIPVYWADDPQGSGQSRAAAPRQGGRWMAVPVLLMGLSPAGALQGRRGGTYGLLIALARTASVLAPGAVADDRTHE